MEEQQIQRNIVQLHIQNQKKQKDVYQKHEINANIHTSKQMYQKLMGLDPSVQNPINQNPYRIILVSLSYYL
jgi:hypothetical protein